MTALSEYQRLETPGVWRASPQDQRRDVIVSVGDATLVIYDGAGRPLAHWSLAALTRRNPGLRPALYAPGPDSAEELELTNPEMIEAVGRIVAALNKRRPHSGRLRYLLLAAALAAVVAAGVLWLPPALISHAASVVPQAKRSDIGLRLLAAIRQQTAAPCSAPLGLRALDALHDRLLGDAPGAIAVLPEGLETAAHLPGGVILVARSLVEDHDDPAVVAGYVLAEHRRARLRDPMERLLADAGPLTALRLLTTGDVEEETLADHARRLLIAEPAPVPNDVLVDAFRDADVSATPYAEAEAAAGAQTAGLRSLDPVDATFAQPVLRDGDWVSLQGICGG